MKKVVQKEVVRRQVRLPAQMGEWLQQRAATNFRSVNAEIVEVIKGVMAEGGNSGASPRAAN